jgi:hypothetical protein
MPPRHVDDAALTCRILSYTLVLSGHGPSGQGARANMGKSMPNPITLRATHSTRTTVPPGSGQYISITLLLVMFQIYFHFPTSIESSVVFIVSVPVAASLTVLRGGLASTLKVFQR